MRVQARFLCAGTAASVLFVVEGLAWISRENTFQKSSRKTSEKISLVFSYLLNFLI